MNQTTRKEIAQMSFMDLVHFYCSAKTGNRNFFKEQVPVKTLMMLYQLEKLIHQEVADAILYNLLIDNDNEDLQ